MTDDDNPSAVQQLSKQSKITVFEVPRIIFLRDKGGHVNRHEFWGETKRSWIGGFRGGRQIKFLKAEYAVVTEESHQEYLWVCRNKYKITSKLDSFDPDYAIWAKIAELIGYAEEKAK